MSTLIVIDRWPTVIQAWVHRMIETLMPDVAAIAASGPRDDMCRQGIPTLPLDNIPAAIWRRIGSRMGLPIGTRPKRTTAEALKEAVDLDSVRVVLIHFVNFAVRFEEVWASTAKPVYVHCHGYDVTWDLRRHDTPDRPVYGAEYLPKVRRLSQRAMMIANSQCTATRLIDAGISKDRIVVKHIGVPVSDIRMRRPTNTSGVEILYLGRLVDCKGPDIVIRAFEIACEMGLDGCLTLAGDGPMRVMCELLQQKSKFRDRICLLGTVDATKGEDLRSRADIFTAHNWFGPLSHQEEAYGLSILEAMADGLPVVSGRSGGVCETVVHGETGVLVEPGDIEAHAEALILLAKNPDLRFQMGEAGWRRVKSHFSSKKERYEFRRILGLDTSLDESDSISKLYEAD